jgi:hypothetical protein
MVERVSRLDFARIRPAFLSISGQKSGFGTGWDGLGTGLKSRIPNVYAVWDGWDGVNSADEENYEL